MTTIKSSATEGVRTLDVIVRDDGLVNLSIGQVGSSCGIQIRKYELLEALDAVAKASPWGELQEDYGRVVRELREARAELAEAEATIERVKAAFHDPGFTSRQTGFDWLVRRALDPKPAFELPTEAGAGVMATDSGPRCYEREYHLFTDGMWHGVDGSILHPKTLMANYIAHRLIDGVA